MEVVAVDELAARTRAALGDEKVPLWLPSLTRELLEPAWERLGRDLGVTKSTYGTARVLTRNPSEVCRVVKYLEVSCSDDSKCEVIPIELLPETLVLKHLGVEVRFYEKDEILSADMLGLVEEGLDVLGQVPTLLSTVCNLVRALHLVEPDRSDIDVSFSDPKLPFSVFVSVPGKRSSNTPLRVAEALLHEAMHLQLTLVEAVLPLVNSSEKAFFSPWRNEYRSARGILHALYVFRVIDSFLCQMLQEATAVSSWRSHAKERRSEIAYQTAVVRPFLGCKDLTPEGATIVDRLLS